MPSRRHHAGSQATGKRIMAAETYCEAAYGHPLHAAYHDAEYGFQNRDDAVLFERLILEINQAGLSWLTVLKKREAFRRAFERYDIDRIAEYGEADRQRLLRSEEHTSDLQSLMRISYA